MNKQKLINKYNDACFAVVSVDEVLEDLQKLDELEKVKIQQFVADWYEENKDDFDYKVWECVFHDGKGEKTEMSEWINRTENAFITLVNMHQFGFEVEKEKRYLVKMKGMDHINGCLTYNKSTENWFFGINGNSKNHRTHHTRKELEEAGFGWVFSCEGVEVKEVE